MRMSNGRNVSLEREQLELCCALPGDLAPRDAQDLMAYPFFSLAKTKRIAPIDFARAQISIRVEAVPEHGMATIWDADVLIWAASQIVEARDRRTPSIAIDGRDALRDPGVCRARQECSRLRPPESSARPPAIHHDRDVDPPIERTAAASLLLDQ